MALRIIKKVVESTLRPQIISSISSTRCYSLYEPDYLESGKSEIPLHDVLNLQMTAYNYSILESYHGFLHNLANNIGIEVETSWALPPQELSIQRFKPKSSVIDAEYKLKVYSRTLQIANPPATLYPILLRMIDASLPEGVTLNVLKHEPEHEEMRYVPDKDLLQLKTQLDEYGGPTKKRRN